MLATSRVHSTSAKVRSTSKEWEVSLALSNGAAGVWHCCRSWLVASPSLSFLGLRDRLMPLFSELDCALVPYWRDTRTLVFFHHPAVEIIFLGVIFLGAKLPSTEVSSVVCDLLVWIRGLAHPVLTRTQSSLEQGLPPCFINVQGLAQWRATWLVL